MFRCQAVFTSIMGVAMVVATSEIAYINDTLGESEIIICTCVLLTHLPYNRDGIWQWAARQCNVSTSPIK